MVGKKPMVFVVEAEHGGFSVIQNCHCPLRKQASEKLNVLACA